MLPSHIVMVSTNSTVLVLKVSISALFSYFSSTKSIFAGSSAKTHVAYQPPLARGHLLFLVKSIYILNYVLRISVGESNT